MPRQLSGSAGEEWRRHWPLVSATTTGMALSSMLTFTFGVMLAPIEQETGWSRAEISTGPTLVSIMGILFATAAGYAIDRLGARRIGLAVAFTVAAAVASLSLVQGLWTWWLVWGVFGLAVAITPAVWMAPVSSLFNAGRGLAISITFAGAGISSFLVPPVSHFLVEAHGWRTAYVLLAAIWGGVTLPLVLLFFRGAEEVRAREAEEPGDLAGLSPREGFRSATLYKLIVAGFLASIAGTAISLNMVPILRSTGIGGAEAAFIAGTAGLCSLGGRIFGGALLDFLDARLVLAVTVLGASALSIALLFFPGSIAAALTGVVIAGLMAGVRSPAIVYMVSRHFGAKSFGTFYGAVSTVTAVCVGLGPLMANYIYDQVKSYEPVMWAAIPGYVLAAAVYFSIGAYPDFGERRANG